MWNCTLSTGYARGNRPAAENYWHVVGNCAYTPSLYHRWISQMASLNISLPAPLREWIEA